MKTTKATESFTAEEREAMKEALARRRPRARRPTG